MGSRENILFKERDSPKTHIIGKHDSDIRKSENFNEKYLISKGLSNFKHKTTKSEAVNQLSSTNKNNSVNSNFSGGLTHLSAKSKNFPISKASTQQEILQQNLHQINNAKNIMYQNNYAGNMDIYETDNFSHEKNMKKTNNFEKPQTTRMNSDKILQRVLPIQNQRQKPNPSLQKFESETTLRQKSGLRIRFNPNHNQKNINSSRESSLININGISTGISLNNNLSINQNQKKQNIENIYGGQITSTTGSSQNNQKASSMTLKKKSSRGVSGNVQKT